jgi:hypothetical protein
MSNVINTVNKIRNKKPYTKLWAFIPHGEMLYILKINTNGKRILHINNT